MARAVKAKNDFYRDVMVLAFPTPTGTRPTLSTEGFLGLLPDDAPNLPGELNSIYYAPHNESCWASEALRHVRSRHPVSI
jgi:hypothetical protein